MTKFINFIHTTGNTVAVNIENIRYVISHDDNVTRILFDQDHIIAVKGNIHEIIHAINTAK
jgi:hypothetical protein